MKRFIKNLVKWNLLLLILISIIGCTTKVSDKKVLPPSKVVSNDQMLAMTPPMGWNSWNPFGAN